MAPFYGPRNSLEAKMDEFGGGFLRSVIVGLVLALGASFLYVWFR